MQILQQTNNLDEVIRFIHFPRQRSMLIVIEEKL